MLHEAQQQCGAQTGDTGQQSDEDDSAAELEGAPTHALNLCHSGHTRVGREPYRGTCHPVR